MYDYGCWLGTCVLFVHCGSKTTENARYMRFTHITSKQTYKQINKFIINVFAFNARALIRWQSREKHEHKMCLQSWPGKCERKSEREMRN